ncbi:RsiV family protein [Stutzerimonas stutzeri]|uniref:RsiV family protein n=1 Tax=Stutzerimonas stutzeri TaxID=316 RepID=UPI000372AFFB|nr:RsiV family protein [Stutzerimonas stutzeri]
MPVRKTIALSALALLMAGCAHLGGDRPIEPRQIVSEQRAANCPETDDSCPLVNVDTQMFAGEAGLNALIDRRLRQMTINTPDAGLPTSLEAYQQSFLHDARPGWSSYLQAKLIDQHDSLLVVELSSYLYTGGAHGMPGRGFINYDREQDLELKLADVLLPGKEGAFWRAAAKAHQRWLVANGHDAEFIRHWPFQQTANVALLRDKVLLKYDAYSIAPYSSGHPTLEMPYEELEGILQPAYL